MLNPSTVRRAEGGYVISSQLVSADPRALPHPSTTLRALDTARPASWRAARTSTLAAVSLTTWTCAPRLCLGKQVAGALQVTRPGAGLPMHGVERRCSAAPCTLLQQARKPLAGRHGRTRARPPPQPSAAGATSCQIGTMGTRSAQKYMHFSPVHESEIRACAAQGLAWDELAMVVTVETRAVFLQFEQKRELFQRGVTIRVTPSLPNSTSTQTVST